MAAPARRTNGPPDLNVELLPYRSTVERTATHVCKPGRTPISLGVVAFVIAASVAASLLWLEKAFEHDPVKHDPLQRGSAEE